jgi:hypothetical protein
VLPDPAATDADVLFACDLPDFPAGSVATYTLTFKPLVAQNISVFGIVTPTEGTNPTYDVIVDNNIAVTCMNMVSTQ